MNCKNCKYWKPLPVLPTYDSEDDDFWGIEPNAQNLASLESFASKSERGQCTRIPSLSSDSFSKPIADDSFCIAKYDAELKIDYSDPARTPIKAYVPLSYSDPHNLDCCFVTSSDFGCALFE